MCVSLGRSELLSTWALVLLLFATALSCRPPKTDFDHLARHSGYRRSVVEGEGFKHLVYEAGASSAGSRLHIYLEGDGVPWIDESRVAEDPTPIRGYALELMALDSAPTTYVGRPCYHRLEPYGACEPTLWTSGRYSEPVVESLAAAVRHVATRRSANNLVVIGFSGGGVLAMLLAERLSSIRGVVTVAANLDIDAWTRVHGYSGLSGSLNPASRPPLPAEVRQIHLAGGRDVKVPSRIVETVASRQPNATFITYPSFDHTCCWTRVWPEILARIEEQLADGTSDVPDAFALASGSRYSSQS